MNAGLKSRLRNLETRQGGKVKVGNCYQVIIDEAPNETERDAQIAAALAEQGVKSKPEDLVIVRTIVDPTPQDEETAA